MIRIPICSQKLLYEKKHNRERPEKAFNNECKFMIQKLNGRLERLFFLIALAGRELKLKTQAIKTVLIPRRVVIKKLCAFPFHHLAVKIFRHFIANFAIS